MLIEFVINNLAEIDGSNKRLDLDESLYQWRTNENVYYYVMK